MNSVGKSQNQSKNTLIPASILKQNNDDFSANSPKFRRRGYKMPTPTNSSIGSLDSFRFNSSDNDTNIAPLDSITQSQNDLFNSPTSHNDTEFKFNDSNNNNNNNSNDYNRSNSNESGRSRNRNPFSRNREVTTYLGSGSNYSCRNYSYSRNRGSYKKSDHLSLRFTKGRSGKMAGLKNLGNTCYFNAVLRSLFSLDCFTNDVLRKYILDAFLKTFLKYKLYNNNVFVEYLFLLLFAKTNDNVVLNDQIHYLTKKNL